MSGNVVRLSEQEHVLKRSAVYLGGITETKTERYYIKDNKIQFSEVTYVPALLKLIREVIDNSIDNGIKNNFKYSNNISIKMTKDTVIVQDNGTGIPVVPAKDSSGSELDELMPTVAWTSLRAGSNFEDNDDNTSIGSNGFGSSLVNIFSTLFIGETCDGTTSYTLVCKDNLSSKEVTTKPGRKRFTRVTFKPDLERIGLEIIEEKYKDLLEFDLMFLKETFPKINFSFSYTI